MILCFALHFKITFISFRFLCTEKKSSFANECVWLRRKNGVILERVTWLMLNKMLTNVMIYFINSFKLFRRYYLIWIHIGIYLCNNRNECHVTCNLTVSRNVCFYDLKKKHRTTNLQWILLLFVVYMHFTNITANK